MSAVEQEVKGETVTMEKIRSRRYYGRDPEHSLEQNRNVTLRQHSLAVHFDGISESRVPLQQFLDIRNASMLL